jgi:hypothetical protein
MFPESGRSIRMTHGLVLSAFMAQPRVAVEAMARRPSFRNEAPDKEFFRPFGAMLAVAYS